MVPDQNPTVRVVDVPEQSRFVTQATAPGQAEGELVYRVEDGRLLLLHTEVPTALEGHGVGGQLVRASVQRAATDHLTLVPWCPFARRWLKEHAAETSGVDVDFTTPPPET